MRNTYKKPLKLDEQTNYIRQNKKVVFGNISEEDAQVLLYEDNYINLITPFKHRFAKKRKDGTTVRDNQHNHIYPDDVDFSSYYQSYIEERSKYPIIFSSIMRFEAIFNSIISYETIHYYGITDYAKFLSFVQCLINNLTVLRAGNSYSPSQLDHMEKELTHFDDEMSKYEDIYIFMDRLSLSNIITVFRCSDQALRTKIFKSLMSANATIGYKTFESFDKALTRIVPIRNCICHSNSLEVLSMYYNIKQKSPRTPTDRKRYRQLIKKLSLG